MKREILFRGINVDNSKWVEGHYFTHIDSCTNCCISDFPKFVYDVIPETVGQFTGLLDKNGKKIFEGDILKTENEKPMIVNWDNNFSSFCLDREDWLFSHYFGEAVEPEKCIVIGNIHDNPELLENA